jgi:DNA topoisomerase-3
MIAIIAEKPSVAKDIARVLNVTGAGNGYLTGNGYMITWAYGHLVSLSLPEDYGKNRLSVGDLPFIPNPFALTIRKTKTPKGMATDKTAAKQLKVIQKVFEQCDSIIVATDAGREGELIFRYIYSFLECKKPFKRLWISSMTDKSIREGFVNLREGHEYDRLYDAADCRAKADYLIGINASNALGIASGIVNNSLGRVQTPTLSMICKRFLEHRSFETSYYHQLHITLKKDGLFRTFTDTEKVEDAMEADRIYEHLKTCSEAQVTKVETKNEQQQPPLLYDLAALQKDANNYHGYTAGKTLEIVQKLYEAKLVSYPRTGSRYIPEDVFAAIPKLIALPGRFCGFENYVKTLYFEHLHPHSVNNEKITDHHALVPTGVTPHYLEKEDKTIFQMIVGRTLEAFSPVCEKELTRIEATCGGRNFESKKSRILFSGWRSVFGRQEDREEDEAGENDAFPIFGENEIAPISGWNLVKRKTLPKPFYTEATLLSAMENAGRLLESEEQRKALKDCGLGTPATRAAIIETLLNRDYIERSGRSLLPTKKGLVVYNCVKTIRIADVELTGYWEQMLASIGQGEQQAETFLSAIEVFTRQITRDVLSLKFDHQSGTIPCPKCGKGHILFYPKTAKCTEKECGLVVFRQLLNKILTDGQLTQLFSGGKIKRIKDFKNNLGKSFDAGVGFDKEYKLKLVFDKSPAHTKNRAGKKTKKSNSSIN